MDAESGKSMLKNEAIAPMFSVVIPLYNKADTIERAVRSVLSQTYSDFELIIVNDGSTDNSLKVVMELAKEISMRIIDKPNGGVSAARNTGVSAARGTYIALLDGDDVWYSNHLEDVADAIERYPDILIFGCGYEKTQGGRLYFTIPWGGCCVKDVYTAFRYAQPIHTSTLVVARKLWNAVDGQDERFGFYEDYDFIFRAGKFSKCCVIRRISGRYSDDASGQITRGIIETKASNLPHICFIERCLSRQSATKEMVKYAKTFINLRMAWAFLSGQADDIETYMREFPFILHSSACLLLMMKNPLIMRIYSHLFLFYYRIRNHLIIWRRRYRDVRQV